MIRDKQSALLLGMLVLSGLLVGCGGGSSSGASSPPPPSHPAITSVSPASATAGGPGFTLTVTGVNFAAASVVRWNHSDLPTTFVSNSTLTAPVSASEIASGRTVELSVENRATGGSESPAFIFTVLNPAPSVASIRPESILAGTSQIGVTVKGTGFVQGSIVQWNGSNRATSFQIDFDGPTLIASIPASDIAAPGSAQITVSNPAPGGGTSVSVPFSIRSANPAPAITSVAPSTVSVIPPDRNQLLRITVRGTGFVESSVAQWNGVNRDTFGTTSTALLFDVLRSDVASTGVASVTVVNPGPGGGTSNTVSVSIVNPFPEVLFFEPTSVPAGSPDFVLTVVGYFVGGSVVRWNGVDLSTTVVEGEAYSQMALATVPASLVASPGNPLIEIVSPGPGGGTATAGRLTIEAPASGNAKLSGQYAFLFTGFNSAGTMSVVGSFTADGNGNLVAGTADVAAAGAMKTDQGLTQSTYSVASDNSGTITLNTAVNFPTGSFRLTFSFALSSFSLRGVAAAGRLIESGNTGQTGTGFFIRQDPEGFSNAAVNGGFAFGLAGPDGIFENAALGRFTASGGSLSAGHVDLIGFGGNGTDLPFTGTYSVTASGRGSAALNIAGRAAPLSLILYVVSPAEIIWIEAGGTGATGKALQQSGGPFTMSSLNGAAVFGAAGFTLGGNDVAVGAVQFDGMGNLNGTNDENYFGTSSGAQPVVGTYTVDSNGLGRGTITEDRGPGLSRFYLISPNRGFIFSGNDSLELGVFEPQTGGPFGNASLSGSYALGSLPLLSSAGTNFASGVLSADGAGGLTGTLITKNGAQTIVGSYAVTANGRTTLSITPDSGVPPDLVFYLVSPSKAVGVPVTAFAPANAAVYVLEKQGNSGP